ITGAAEQYCINDSTSCGHTVAEPGACLSLRNAAHSANRAEEHNSAPAAAVCGISFRTGANWHERTRASLRKGQIITVSAAASAALRFARRLRRVARMVDRLAAIRHGQAQAGQVEGVAVKAPHQAAHCGFRRALAGLLAHARANVLQ